MTAASSAFVTEQVGFQRSRMLRTGMRSLVRLLQSPPWRDLVVVDATTVGADPPDMIVELDGRVHAPPRPGFTIRDGLDPAQAELAAALGDMLAYREDLLRRATELAATHHRTYLHARGPQGNPPDKSTCERVVGCSADELDIYAAHKQIETPRGRVELQTLFRRPPSDEPSASDLVKAVIAEVIAAESPDAPLSDDEIRAALAAREILISGGRGERDPIARYRTALGIPPAAERKRPR
jgi:hypothetical protein